MDLNILRIDINRIVATDINLGGILTSIKPCICGAEALFHYKMVSVVITIDTIL